MDIKGSVALITGAASGFGREFALLGASLGMKLVLADVQQEALEKTAAEVRASQAFYRQAGITAVPSVIVNDKYLIQGGQPAEAFEQALRQIAAQPAA